MAIYIGVTQEEKLAILRRTNISPAWLSATTEACRLFDCDLSIRASQALALHSTVPGVSKPTSYKAKTVKRGLEAGSIPEKSIYQELHGVKVSAAEIAENPETCPLRINLSAILSDATEPAPRFAIKLVGDMLYVESTDKADKTAYAINLKDSRAYPQTRANTLHGKPQWWKEEWGNFNAVLDRGFSVQYAVRKPGEETVPVERLAFKDYLVYAINGEQIMWDIDTLGTIRSLEPQKNSLLSPPPPPPASAMKVYNTFTPDGRKQMLQALIDLHKFACAKDRNVYNGGRSFSLDDIPDEAIIGKWGCLQPYEAYFLHVINLRVYEQQVPQVAQAKDERPATPDLAIVHAQGKLKHGSETFNPGDPSDIIPAVIAKRNGEVVYAETEKDLVDYLLKKADYLKENYFNVHHGWDMNEWNAVVARQLEYGQEKSIPEKTLTAYFAYLAGVRLLQHHQEVLKVGSEEKMIEKILQDGQLLMRHRLQVQPSWSMEKWAPVVAKQLELRHSVPSLTLLRFYCHQYQAKNENELARKVLENPDALKKIRVQHDWNTAAWAAFLMKQVDAGQKLEAGVTKNLISYLRVVQAYLDAPELGVHACKKKHGLLDRDDLQSVAQMKKFVAERITAMQLSQIEPFRAPTTAQSVLLFSQRSPVTQPHPEVMVSMVQEMGAYDFTEKEKLASIKELAQQSGWHFSESTNAIYFRDQNAVYGVQIHADHLSAEMNSDSVKKVMVQITQKLGLQPNQLNIEGKLSRADFEKEMKVQLSEASRMTINKL